MKNLSKTNQFRIKFGYYGNNGKSLINTDDVVVTKLPTVSIDEVLQYCRDHKFLADYNLALTNPLGFTIPLKDIDKHNSPVVRMIEIGIDAN